jgi:hypothetical protein
MMLPRAGLDPVMLQTFDINSLRKSRVSCRARLLRSSES